jgi:hypothetical protein
LVPYRDFALPRNDVVFASAALGVVWRHFPELTIVMGFAPYALVHVYLQASKRQNGVKSN